MILLIVLLHREHFGRNPSRQLLAAKHSYYLFYASLLLKIHSLNNILSQQDYELNCRGSQPHPYWTKTQNHHTLQVPLYHQHITSYLLQELAHILLLDQNTFQKDTIEYAMEDYAHANH